mmetsp:Transcript_22068/g.35094  ORF Transcript_22068/g.35094 Transcript_22068/m.35094 type:complete len:233 (-) Transcript_22068:25-723(-)
MGLFSLEAMQRSQDVLAAVTSNPLGQVVLYGALLTHMGLALYRLARKRTLRMPVSEAGQVLLGLLIPLLLMTHIVHTRVAENRFEVEPEMGFIAGLIWNSPNGWQQAALLLVVWGHACIGLHMWLRVLPAWRRVLPGMLSLATLVPAFALAGFLVQGRLQNMRLFDPVGGAALRESYGFPSAETFARLAEINSSLLGLFVGLVALTMAVHFGRRFIGARRAVRIRYVDGPEI